MRRSKRKTGQLQGSVEEEETEAVKFGVAPCAQHSHSTITVLQAFPV